MSHSELTRLEILQRIEDRRLSQAQAATMLGLTDRQMPFRDHILAIVGERYADFGPTLAREKLFERHGLIVQCETLRG